MALKLEMITVDDFTEMAELFLKDTISAEVVEDDEIIFNTDCGTVAFENFTLTESDDWTFAKRTVWITSGQFTFSYTDVIQFNDYGFIQWAENPELSY